MSTLRVLLASAPAPAQDVPWALFDAQEKLVRAGIGTPSTWPAADRREAVLAASVVRLASLALPPMPADRLAAAATFALEDQLAGAANTQHLTASARKADGTVEVAVAARSLVGALQRDFARVLAEPALAPVPAPGIWRWCRSQRDDAFVRKPDGSAFAVSAPAASGVPDELALALAHARRAGGKDLRVDVAFPVDDAELATWSAQCGLPFLRGIAWRWDHDGTAIARAPDLLHGEFSRAPAIARGSALSRFRWAAGLAAAALLVHVGATLVQWSTLRYSAWQASRTLVRVAREAGVVEAADSDAAAAALARKFADARHRAGLGVADDALPLLARAAPALAALPPGAFKSASYGSATWTFDLARLDPAVAATLDRQLTGAGIATLQATSPTGTRLRASLVPGAELP
jgi:hypothetical protein